MKQFIILVPALLLVASCSNFKDDLKETGDAVQTGTQNAIEGLKEVPAAVSEASNKVEKKIRD